jgi:hypothetical protein
MEIVMELICMAVGGKSAQWRQFFFVPTRSVGKTHTLQQKPKPGLVELEGHTF